VLGAVFGYSGYAMQASFSVADPSGAPSRNPATMLYLTVAGLSLLVAAAAGVMLILRARERAS